MSWSSRRPDDAPEDWLRIGQALQRVPLAAAALAFRVAPPTSRAQVGGSLRRRVAGGVGYAGYPQVVLVVKRSASSVGEADAGKTTLTKRLLYAAGVIDEFGSVDEGTTQTDALTLEHQRGITIRAAVVAFPIDHVMVNVIDTPGHPAFIAEVDRSLSVRDGAVLVVSAVEGVPSQTVVLMRTLHRLRIPTLNFINKIDGAGADPERVSRRGTVGRRIFRFRRTGRRWGRPGWPDRAADRAARGTGGRHLRRSATAPRWRPVSPPPTLETAVVARENSQRGALHAGLTQLAEADPLINLRQQDASQELFVSL